MEKARRIALLIGVGDYLGMPKLRQPAADARAIRQILEQRGDFACTLLEDPNFYAMRDALLSHFNSLKTADTGLLYFSGHGVKDAGDLYLCARDMDPGDPGKHGLPGEEIRRRIANPTGARTHIIILDCCYAGAITKSDPNTGQDCEPPKREMFDPGSGSGVVFFAATDPRSQAPTETKGAAQVAISPYTNLLLEGLSGEAGGDELYVTTQALDRFLRRLARERNLGLTPTYSANHLVSDDIRLTVNPIPGWSRVPSHVREAIDAPEAFTRIGGYFALSVHAGNSDELPDSSGTSSGTPPVIASDVAKRLMETRLNKEALKDGRVSEAIRNMLKTLEATSGLRQVQHQLKTLETEREALKAEVTRLASHLRSALQNETDSQAALRKLTASEARLKKDLKTTKEENKSLKDDHAEASALLNSERQACARQLRALNAELIKQKQEFSEANANISATNKARVAAETLARNVEHRLTEATSALEASLVEQNNAVSVWQQVVDEALNEARLAKDELGIAERRLSAALDEVNILQRKLSATDEEARRLTSKIIDYFITNHYRKFIAGIFILIVTLLITTGYFSNRSGYRAGLREGSALAISGPASPQSQSTSTPPSASTPQDKSHSPTQQRSMFDADSDTNLPNIMPTGHAWIDDPICAAYLRSDADSWRTGRLLDKQDGSYNVWVYSNPSATKDYVAKVADRFNSAFPDVNFVPSGNVQNVWGVLVASGLPTIEEAEAVGNFARRCVSSASAVEKNG